MDTKLKTLRITEFKGLNKSANPHNIDDAEFTEMINVELSENRTLQSRMGITKVIDHIDSAVISILGIHKVDWDDYTSTLYSARSWGLLKNDETTGYESWLALLQNPTQRHVRFQRWHDRILMLAQGESVMWMDSSENLTLAAYPQFQYSTSATSTSSTSTGGSLDDSVGYQYNISVVLGSDGRDGETAGALPIPEWTLPEYDVKNPPPGPHWLPEYYLQKKTSSTDRTLVFVDATYDASLGGFDIGYIKLFRRKCRVISGSASALDVYVADGAWVQIDTVYVNKENDVYSLDTTRSSTGVITSLTGTYDSTTDSASVLLGITDDGTVDYDAGVSPMPSQYLTTIKAKHMARMNNRVFLGNIVGNDPRDKKMVRFSYTGYLDKNATMEEIPNFHYHFPMLIFGPYSWFYCDHEDTDDEITGLYGYRNSLIIFTGKCTLMWQEGMADPVKISNDVGCIAPETIREFEGRLIWLSANGVVVYDGSNLNTMGKANSFITNLSKDYAWKACAAIFKRRYYISAPFTGTTNNASVLVYDFDLKEWAERVYKITDSATYFYIDCFYKYNDGAKEVLYGGGHDSASTTSCFIVKIDEGYDDGGTPIECSLKTKYFDFGAPDIVKNTRAFNLDITNRNAGTLTIDMYLDGLNVPGYTFTYSGATDGFLLNDASHGRLNVDSIVNITDEMFAFSLPIGKHASRVQFGLGFDAGSDQTVIHAISFDWRVVRKLQRKYGGT